MVSSDTTSHTATHIPRPSSDIALGKRTADEDVPGESTATKRAAISARGQLTMRRSGATASFRRPISRGSTAVGGHKSTFPQRASLSRPGYRPETGIGPLSLPTPTKFDVPAKQSSSTRGKVLSPTSSSASSFSSAASSAANFELSIEVKHNLSHTAPEAPDRKSRTSLASSLASTPVVAPRNFIPQFGPARRMPPESDDENYHSQAFKYRLSQAQKRSSVWAYIKEQFEITKFTCKSNREREAMLEILQLPSRNDLDDKPMRGLDRHQRRYNVIMGSILQVVGVKGHCGACGSHFRKNWEHRKKTCTGLPPEATGPKYRQLFEFVDGRCSNCIRCNLPAASCQFAVGDEVPVDAPAQKIPRAVTDRAPGNSSSQNRAKSQRSEEFIPPRPSKPPALGSNSQARAPDTAEENGASGHAEAIVRDTILVSPSQPPAHGSSSQARAPDAPAEKGAGSSHAEAIVRDAILVGFRASMQLQPQEQRGFHSWLTALLSFSSSSPDLEDQALAALARLRQLDPDVQADIRRRILQMLPGAMGQPA